jgi:hypothetical protein
MWGTLHGRDGQEHGDRKPGISGPDTCFETASHQWWSSPAATSHACVSQTSRMISIDRSIAICMHSSMHIGKACLSSACNATGFIGCEPRCHIVILRSYPHLPLVRQPSINTIYTYTYTNTPRPIECRSAQQSFARSSLALLPPPLPFEGSRRLDPSELDTRIATTKMTLRPTPTNVGLLSAAQDRVYCD